MQTPTIIPQAVASKLSLCHVNVYCRGLDGNACESHGFVRAEETGDQMEKTGRPKGLSVNPS